MWRSYEKEPRRWELRRSIVTRMESVDASLGWPRRVGARTSLRLVPQPICWRRSMVDSCCLGSRWPLAPRKSRRIPRSRQGHPPGSAFNDARDGTHDRFVLSPAHYSGALCAALCKFGRLDESDLQQYATNGTSMEMIGSEQSPGLEATTGSLAQGLSVGVGMALARRLRSQDGTVWVLTSDGELEEGQTWEALAAATHHVLGNLVVLVDANGLRVDSDPASIIGVGPIAEWIRALGFETHEVNGHDPSQMAAAASKREPATLTAIVCRTIPWQGLPILKARYPRSHHFAGCAPRKRLPCVQTA